MPRRHTPTTLATDRNPPLRTSRQRLITWCVAGLCAVTSIRLAWAGDTSIKAQLSHWTAQAGQPADARRGEVFFNTRHGNEWSCASCHGTPPTREGQHANTGKAIAPLAPAFNHRAFTDTAKVNKWFRRNCKDVLSRECSATEKADVLAYLAALK